MASLQDLPVEILTEIFGKLSSIDDADHVARCCRDFHALFEDKQLNNKIMMSIVEVSVACTEFTNTKL